MFVFTPYAEEIALRALVADGLTMHLFVNETTPTRAIAQDLIEPDRDTGYRAANLPQWSIADSAGAMKAMHADAVFSFQKPVAIRGHFYVDRRGRRLGAEAWKTAIDVGPDGGRILITPEILIAGL